MLLSVLPTLTDVSTLLLMYADDVKLPQTFDKATHHLKQDLEDLLI